jgi:hypothetical protein
VDCTNPCIASLIFLALDLVIGPSGTCKGSLRLGPPWFASPGDWVWVHMRKERFPAHRKTKLHPRGDGPFQILEKINDNAYKVDLPGEYKVFATFNVSDLSPFDVGEDS